ncbi:MAG TPA: antibiotic biosynthesis monooxygenase, partial [Thermodesulfobacteriota bacterium]|nr:antibiotic biosynthesis monooxygenase [Thermodesulfobacteriota bacterium]
ARVQPGCISCYFYQDVENENAFILVEEWTTRETLEGHIREKNYRKLLALMDFLSEPPQVKFNTISSTQGMEYVVRVLGLNRSKLDVKEDLQ